MNDNPELYRGNIIMSRVRLARNVFGMNFRITDKTVANEIVKKVYHSLLKVDTFNLYQISNLDRVTLNAMKERHLISEALMENRKFGAVLVNQDKNVSIMVHEEDILREQCFEKGLRLAETYKKLDRIDDEIAKNLSFAFDDQLGFLTACPTNLGTGLRASVMMFLPALTESGKIGKLLRSVSEVGLTIRGVYGEGSDGEGAIYQISNEVTLGVKEYDIIKKVEKAVIEICELERKETTRLYKGKELKVVDRAKRAFGILTNAVLLNYNEFLGYIAQVKLGAMLGLLPISDIEEIDDLIISVRPAVLQEQYGREMTAIDRDLFRAEVVGKKLLKIKE